MRRDEQEISAFLWVSLVMAVACTESRPFDAIAERGKAAPNDTIEGRAGGGDPDVGAVGSEPSDVGSGSGDTGANDTGTGNEAGLADMLDLVGVEQVYELGLHDAPAPMTLELNREEVAAVFGARARDVLLIEIAPTAFLTESLERIKNACGASWTEDNPDPRHDCSLSELGRSFAGPDGRWQTSAEYALVRILTMTPANVDVSGTSSESLRELADFLGIGGGYSQILSDALGIARTDPIVSTDALVGALETHFIGSHPNTRDGGKLAITLEDALTDLATLADRYGPQDGHPGVIDPSLAPSGVVLGPDFRLRIVASSNVRQCDGIDADSGQHVVSIVADETGPTFEDELEFDFEDPDRFSITGLVTNPTIDLRFRIGEASQFVPSCLGARCQANSPGMPLGNGSVWAVAPWLLEYDIAAAARIDYINRTFDGRYLLGLASVSLGRDGTPPGWIAYDVPLNVGNPPADQYVWETILEVAQVALHQTPFASIPEGQADVVFGLNDVPVGLTGARAAQNVRPYLQEQNAGLSDFLLADFEADGDSVDFYYCRAGDGEPYLFFVGEADMKDEAPYLYEHPGFFRTSTLEERLSSTRVPGVSDTLHEKLPIVAGETVVHFEDDRGIVHRARIVRNAGSDDIEVSLRRAAE
jgi:hypothetical protein